MIVVDDRLSLDALAGRLGLGSCATTWCFHYRLMRALTGPSQRGHLGRRSDGELRLVVTHPPAERLVVLDPREFTALAADLSMRHGLNLLAAEMVAACLHHRADLHLSAGNLGRDWTAVLEAEGVTLTVH